MASLTREQRAEAIATIYGHLAQGKTDRETMNEMGLTALEYEELKTEFFDAKADEFRTRPVEHVYVQYMLDQTANLHDLTELIEIHRRTRNANAVVGAIRVRSDILDKLVARGQEFGLIHKEANKTIIAGALVSDLTNQQLKEAITTELGKLEQLTRRYGDETPIAALQPAEKSLYYGPKGADPPANPEIILPPRPKRSIKKTRQTQEPTKPSATSESPPGLMEGIDRDRERFARLKFMQKKPPKKKAHR